jgi:DNA-binding PadR family transcriptional regulator
VVILDEAANELCRIEDWIRWKVLASVDAHDRLAVNEQHALDHAVLAHLFCISFLDMPTSLRVVSNFDNVDLQAERRQWDFRCSSVYFGRATMADQDLYSGLIRLHVLYHASRGPVFGLGMIRELRHHGYRVGPGTLYPILHRLEQKRYLKSKSMRVEGKQRRVYAITARGRSELGSATAKVRELYDEMVEGHGEPSPAHPKTGKH